jgi:hypothetical protein
MSYEPGLSSLHTRHIHSTHIFIYGYKENKRNKGSIYKVVLFRNFFYKVTFKVPNFTVLGDRTN